MIRRPLFPRTLRVGIAIDRDRVIAAIPGDDPVTPWGRPLTPPGDADATCPDLAAALGELRARCVARREGVARDELFRGELSVALLSPLGELRRVELPGLSLAEARQVLRREPSRYLARSADSATLELEAEGEGWRRSSPFTVFAASRTLVAGIHAAAQASGWRMAGIVPAEDAWVAAASALLPAKDGDEHALVLCRDDRVDVVRARNGRTLGVRRFPAAAPGVMSLVLSALAHAGGGPRTSVAVVGDSPLADELRLMLAAPRGGAPAAVAPNAWCYSPALLAARFAMRAPGPRLLPEGERAVLAHRTRRANVFRFTSAAALLVATALVQLWGLSRERGAIAAERARLHEPVTRALAVRDSLGQASDRLATIRSASTTAPRWAPLLVALSARLPDDAFLLSLRADRGSLRLEGEAARAEAVFDALRGMHGIAALRPGGPIRQQIAEDGSTSERFTISARVVREP